MDCQWMVKMTVSHPHLMISFQWINSHMWSIPSPIAIQPHLHHLILRGIETAQFLAVPSARFQQVHVGEERRAGHRVEHVGKGGVLRRNQRWFPWDDDDDDDDDDDVGLTLFKTLDPRFGIWQLVEMYEKCCWCKGRFAWNPTSSNPETIPKYEEIL